MSDKDVLNVGVARSIMLWLKGGLVGGVKRRPDWEMLTLMMSEEKRVRAEDMKVSM
jgi:hypothetical protein